MSVFRFERKAQYHETDKMGIIHHANFIKWMEEARVEFLESIGWSFSKIEEAGIFSPVVGLQIEYRKQVQFEDVVEIRLSILRYNGTILELEYEFVDLTKGDYCAKATSRHAFVKDDQLVSLRRVLPEMDEKIREMKE